MTDAPADCVFCQIVAGEAPAYVVAESDAALAILDRSQVTPGHTIVIPRAHAADIWAISEDDLLAVTALARQVALLIEDRLGPDGMNLTQSNGRAGDQKVFHLHLHVIPRWNDDGIRSPWRSTHPTDDRLAQVHAELT